MATTPILALENIELATPGNDPRSSGAKENHDIKMTAAYAALDAFAGAVTGSFVTRFSSPSGTLMAAGFDIGSEYVRTPRVIQEVIAYCPASGSNPAAGFTQLDVQVQDAAGVFNSIFNAANLKPCVTASLGNYAVNKVSTFRTGSIAAGKIVRANIDASNAGAGAYVVLEVLWKPSGSYSA